MEKENVAEVSIIDGQLNVKPSHTSFEFIYRAAMEINWDSKNKTLYSPIPKEWTYFDWYKQIDSAVFNEYGCLLEITDKTNWNNISDELKEEILKYYKNRKPNKALKH